MPLGQSDLTERAIADAVTASAEQIKSYIVDLALSRTEARRFISAIASSVRDELR